MDEYDRYLAAQDDWAFYVNYGRPVHPITITMPEPTTEAPPSPTAAPAAAPAPTPVGALPQPVLFTGQPLEANSVLRRLNSTPLQDYSNRYFFPLRQAFSPTSGRISFHDFGEWSDRYLQQMFNNMEVMPVLHDITAMPHRLVTLYKYGTVPAGTLFSRDLMSTRRVWRSSCSRFTFDLVDFAYLAAVISAVTAPVKDDGQVDARFRPLISGSVRLNPIIKAQIENFPAASTTRGLIRQKLLQPPPATATTAAAIFAWIDSLPIAPPITPPPVNTPTPVTRVTVQPAPQVTEDARLLQALAAAHAPVRAAPRVQTRALEVSINVEVSGHTNWTRTDVYAGRLQIPVDVIDDGEEAVEEFIHENYHDLRCSPGETDYSDEDDDDTDVGDITADIDQLIEDRQEEIEDDGA